MAKKKAPNAPLLRPYNPIDMIEVNIDAVKRISIENLNAAAGAVRGLGDITFSRHNGCIEGLNSDDMQSIGLAIESLGRYIETLSAEIESEMNSATKEAHNAKLVVIAGGAV